VLTPETRRYIAGDLAGLVDRIRAPDIATEVGHAIVPPDIDVTEVVDGVGIQLRIDVFAGIPSVAPNADLSDAAALGTDSFGKPTSRTPSAWPRR
jgi:hypothetical protein